jgi:predicted nucleotidyltransferase
MSKIKAKKIAEKYAEKLKAENYPFAAVYLFGSYVKGMAGEWSDIDVAVVSDKLKKNWNKNEDILWRYTIDIDSRIEPIGFTVRDFKNICDPMVAEIKKTGIRVA